MATQQIIKVITVSYLLLGIWACSSGSDQDLEDEMNVGNENTESESINNAEGEEVVKNNEFAEGEEVNNAADNEFANDFANSQGNNKLNLGNQASQNAVVANNTAAPTNLSGNTASSNPAAELAAADAATTAPAATTPVPTSGGVVKYVKSTAALTDQPGGATVGSLEQGDHPVVWSEGDYARTHHGYVSGASLSDKGIGRERKSNQWRSGE